MDSILETGELTVGYPCHKDTESIYLDNGRDSEVYKVGNFAIHVYNVDKKTDTSRSVLTQEKLDLYKQIVDDAVKYADASNLRIFLPFSHKEVPIRFNPILRLYKCDTCKKIESVSPFIDKGTRGDEAREIFDMIELQTALKGLNSKLEDHFKVAGINVIPKNLKVTDDGTLLVTDLCSDIANLSKINY